MDQKCSGNRGFRIFREPPEPSSEAASWLKRTRGQCLMMPECEKSGYGVYTSDNKFLKFDEAGNRKALAAIKATTRIDDMEVEVTGQVKDDTIKVATLKILPPID